MRAMSRNGWLAVAGASGLVAVCVGWGDSGSILFGTKVVNMALCFVFTLLACYAVYRAGPD